MNPETPKKNLGNLFSNKTRSIAVLAGGLLLLIILLVVVASALQPKSIKPELLKLSQTQTELIRITGLNNAEASSNSTNNFVSSANLVLTGQQNDLSSLLTSQNIKFSSKDLALGQNPKTDTDLTEASSNGNFDSTINQIMSRELNIYSNELSDLFSQTRSASLKSQLSSDYQNVQQLLEMQKQSD